MRFALIDAERAEPRPVASVAEMCRVLEVSRAGYYAWKDREPCQRERDDVALAAKVLEIHERGRRNSGRPRIHDKLKKQGVHVSGKVKKKFVVTTDSDHPLEVAPNVLDRNFTASGPNERWVGDITYLYTPEGRVYLAVVIDLFSRMVVGWSIGTVIDRLLVLRALDQAKQRRGTVAGGHCSTRKGVVSTGAR